MWITTTYGFFSLTRVMDSEMMQIRARNESHLKNLMEAFPQYFVGSEINTKYGTDYPCRIFVSRSTTNALMGDLTDDISYSNFKNAVHASGKTNANYSSALNSVWGIMLRTEEPRDRFEDHPKLPYFTEKEK